MIDLRFTEKKDDLKKYLILLSFIPAVLFTIVGITTGINSLTNNDFFIIYIILVGFTLPFLLAKVILDKPLISINSIYCILVYFITYLFVFIISKILTIPISQIYSILGVAFVATWHYLLYKYIKKGLIDEIDANITNIALVIVPIILFAVVMYFLRQYLALHSTDILVHKTVLNGMLNPSQFDVMPSNYSTTFTDQGYPIVIYHSIIFWMLNSFNLNFIKFAYLVDFVFSFLSALIIFRLVYAHFNKILLSLGVVAFSLFTFENLAYTTQFFIPQTFTFLIFLAIVASGRLTFKKLLLAILILIISHFFIGAYLSVVLIAKYLIVDKKLFNKDNKFEVQWPILLALLFTLSLSFANFSVEKSFQQSIVSWVGMITAPTFVEKTQNLIELWGINILIVVIALVGFIFKKKKNDLETTAFIIAAAGFGTFYLGPAFASKFLLGIGICAAILIVSFINDLKGFKYTTKLILCGTLIASFIFSYAIAYTQPLPFLTQNDGTISAYVKKDEGLVNFWNNAKPNCTLLSDPQTQQTIHTFGNGNTARGYYLTLDARAKIISFMVSPTKQKLDRLLTIEEFKDNNGPICFDLTARLRELVDKNQIWTQIIFNYKIDHDSPLNLEDKALVFLQENGNTKLYQDNYSAVFIIR